MGADAGPGHFVAAVVEAATARLGTRWGRAVIRCTLGRPVRPRCSAFVEVRSAGEDEIAWRCTACGNRGTVRGWARGPFDLRRARDARATSGRRTVRLSVPEYDAIANTLTIGADHPEVLAAATPALDREEVVLRATADELDGLCDAVAAGANHAGSRGTQRLLDGAFDRLSAVLDPPRPPARAATLPLIDGPVTAEAVADQIAAMFGVSGEAGSRYRGVFVEAARAGLDARRLEQRIRMATAEAVNKAPLVVALELASLLDQASTFARLHPDEGVRVLAAFISALRAAAPTEDLAPLISESATTILAAAKAAHDPRLRREAVRTLVSAYIEDARFAAVATILERRRIGKRGVEAALNEIERVDDTATVAARTRAEALRRVLSAELLS